VVTLYPYLMNYTYLKNKLLSLLYTTYFVTIIIIYYYYVLLLFWMFFPYLLL